MRKMEYEEKEINGGLIETRNLLSDRVKDKILNRMGIKNLSRMQG